jgi:hypothetical protein
MVKGCTKMNMQITLRGIEAWYFQLVAQCLNRHKDLYFDVSFPQLFHLLAVKLHFPQSAVS